MLVFLPSCGGGTGSLFLGSWNGAWMQLIYDAYRFFSVGTSDVVDESETGDV